MCYKHAFPVNPSQRLHDGSFRTDEMQKQGRDVECLFLEHLNSQSLSMCLSSLPVTKGWAVLLGLEN